MKELLSFIMLTPFLLAFNVEVSNSIVENGRTALLEFESNNSIEYKKIIIDKKEFNIYPSPTNTSKLYALVPISYYEKPSEKKVIINYLEKKIKKSKNIILKLVKGDYKQEEIHVDKSKVNPKDDLVKKRISKEYVEAMSIYNTVTKENYINKKFILPINSKITSAFGKARTYNGSLKGYHSGTDFRAKTGTPIVASNDAKVVLVKDRFYSGGTVLLDHGHGIYSCYYHMSKFLVQEGDKVKCGDTIGLSGESGRVTGPHLHFSARINGIQVDPLQFISLMNNNILKGN